eukprot:4140021-Pyramimonas_sp.AAC.1
MSSPLHRKLGEEGARYAEVVLRAPLSLTHSKRHAHIHNRLTFYSHHRQHHSPTLLSLSNIVITPGHTDTLICPSTVVSINVTHSLAHSFTHSLPHSFRHFSAPLD